MKKTLSIAILLSGFLAACGGGGGGGSTPPPVNPPVTGLAPPAFNNLAGTTPADAALGQPLDVQWTLPAGVALQSVTLDAELTAGPQSSPATCEATAGTLAPDATAATITLPNTCGSKTVKQVVLRLAIQATDGRRSSATRTFNAPGDPAGFVPRRVSLPVLRITTQNLAPIVSRDVYLPAQLYLESNVAGEAPVNSSLEIRGRGNSTWDLMPKKPYRLKLTAKLPLLGMPSSRDWVLLANYSDKSLMRNALAMELGASLGMPWAPRSRFVELYLNDRYDGVYQLMENIKIAKDRVDIDELGEDDDDADVVTGGYLLEVDFRQDGHTIFSATENLPIVFKDPEEPSPAQESYLKGYIDEFESVLYSGDFADPVNGYARYIDVDSFIRWFIVNEVFRNRDANMWSSCWMYKPRGGKLHMGPLWDFDIAAGNIDYDAAWGMTGWWIRDAPWFSRLFEDPAFVARVREMWNEARGDQLTAMLASIRTRASEMQQSQLNNFQRWPILEMYVWPNYRIPGSYGGEIDYVESWLTTRIAWMDDQFNP